MSQIVSKRTIPADARSVFNAARDVERFAAELPDVDKVEVLEDHGNGTVVTRWSGTMSVGPLTKQVSWTEKDEWSEGNLSCSFKLVEGDMKKFDGVWTFTDNNGECDVLLNVDFELGIPVLGPMVNRIVDELMQKNCDEMLAALERMVKNG